MFFAKCRPIEVDSPIFVIGVPRSGTTVISEAISLHEDVGWFSNYMNKLPFLPELSLISRIVDTPGIGWYLRGKKKQTKSMSSLIRRCLPYSVEAFPVWKQYLGDKILWDYLVHQTATKSEKYRIRKVIKRILLLQGKSRFFAKFTGPPRIHYLSSIFPNAYFVHVLRDPRAVVSSLLRIPFWTEGGGLRAPWWQNGLGQDYIEEWIECSRSPAALAAVQWKRIIEVGQHEGALQNSRYIELRYEEFVRDPDEALEGLFPRINLTFSKNVKRYVNSIGRTQNMNFKYKQELLPLDILLVEKITCRTARKVGYIF